MDFSRTNHQGELVALVQVFCEQHCSPDYVTHLDQQPRFPTSAYTAMADAGILGYWLPAKYGGHGGGFLDGLLIRVAGAISDATGSIAAGFWMSPVLLASPNA
ncbi:acyl-CoA dehydrogenase family protein [Bradyrhizobium icense]|uniref:Acyl-CoA dehydrogenase/oxidase N-terminal domain-containing protein n=1 Tax=Bradyrhizobium icense TaxID=1274631 RepID=A0A1B1UBH8_9BRAD|nr:acyl-CoA dehydrogenase family protein [Bradyrhizobium icense]ANW00130.1 hypothetical protein LMTR13_07970 [Bradyrhizobium icense]